MERLPAGQSDRLNAVRSYSESRCFHTAFANAGPLNQPAIVVVSVPSDSLLTHDKASLSLVTNEEKRGTVTLLQSTEQAVELAEIAAEARDYVAASRAENTTRVYRTGWAQFTAWCDEHRVMALPAGPETVACYVADLAKAAKPATIDLRLAAISAAHRAAGYESPTKEEAVRLVRRGVRRTLGTAQRQVRPVTVPDLRTMLAGTRQRRGRVSGPGTAPARLRGCASPKRACRARRCRYRRGARRAHGPPQALEDRPGGRRAHCRHPLRLEPGHLPGPCLARLARGLRHHRGTRLSPGGPSWPHRHDASQRSCGGARIEASRCPSRS